MSSSPLSSPIPNFQNHFVETFNISQRAQVLFHLIWTHRKGIDVRYKTEKFCDKKILQSKMQIKKVMSKEIWFCLEENLSLKWHLVLATEIIIRITATSLVLLVNLAWGVKCCKPNWGNGSEANSELLRPFSHHLWRHPHYYHYYYHRKVLYTDTIPYVAPQFFEVLLSLTFHFYFTNIINICTFIIYKVWGEFFFPTVQARPHFLVDLTPEVYWRNCEWSMHVQKYDHILGSTYDHMLGDRMHKYDHILRSAYIWSYAWCARA